MRTGFKSAAAAVAVLVPPAALRYGSTTVAAPAPPQKSRKLIYLDHNATTPLRQEVLQAMLPFLRDGYGNPSSVHQLGSRARCAIEEARAEVAMLVSAEPAEIVFTSGGTESNNTVLRNRRVVTTAIEHSSVLAAADAVATLPVDVRGMVAPQSLLPVLAAQPDLISIGWANNELGTLQPIEAISIACRNAGVRLHSDAVQAAGKVPVKAELVDYLSLSAHKLGGPKGIGALYVRRGAPFDPLLRGGAQERERRAGTENVAGIVGMGVACRLAAAELGGFAEACVALRDALWDGLRDIDGIVRHTPGETALPNTLHVRFAAVRGEALVAALDLEGVAVSSGSACAAGAGEPSHVLMALGCDPDQARNGVRFSVGRGNTLGEIEVAIAATRRAIERVRAVRGAHS